MIKIMFVCTGNICRSAMAEYLMKKKLALTRLEDKIRVYSCGTYAYTGDLPTYEAMSVMKSNYGIDMSTHVATALIDSQIDDMDLIFCMTDAHKETLMLRCKNLQDRIFVLKEYVGLTGDISDPYGYGLDAYEKCITEIEKCLDLLIIKEFRRD